MAHTIHRMHYFFLAGLIGTAYGATGDAEETIEEDAPLAEFPDRSTIPVLSPEGIDVSYSLLIIGDVV